MINFLCAEGTNPSSIVVSVILIVVLVGMLILPYFTQRKKNQEYSNMLSSLKVGDLVKTAGGIIGKINKITDKGEIKTVILETGSKSEKSYMELDISMIYCVLKSSKVDNAEEKTSETEEKEEETVKTSEPEAKEPKAKKTKTTSTSKTKKQTSKKA